MGKLKKPKVKTKPMMVGRIMRDGKQENVDQYADLDGTFTFVCPSVSIYGAYGELIGTIHPRIECTVTIEEVEQYG